MTTPRPFPNPPNIPPKQPPKPPRSPNSQSGWLKPPNIPAKKPPKVPVSPRDRLDPAKQDAYQQLVAVFKTYGLESLSSKIMDYVKKGYDPDTISIMLQETPEWKARFIGNEERRKAGLPVLDPATYLATETAMKDVLRNYGLPKSFYDEYRDFGRLIGANVSPDEVAARARYAWEFTQSSQSAESKRLLKEWYGVDDSFIVGALLDPKLGQQAIERMGHTVQYGRIAAQGGFDVRKSLAQAWADLGLTQEQVTQGVAEAGVFAETTEDIAARFGDSYTETDALNETVTGDAEARRRRESLWQKEAGLFRGQGGLRANALGTGDGY
ncbi:hypothetical protein [Streptomyces hydrogenans]|uniref:hypothetical protein n=1 Tax=Streptomyces hydrogenans TaxID=1873719 RepID=UPI0035E25DC2